MKTEVEKQGLKPAAIAEKVRTISREAEQALKNEAEKVMPEPLKATGTSMPTGAGQRRRRNAAAARARVGSGMSARVRVARCTTAWDPAVRTTVARDATGTTGTKKGHPVRRSDVRGRGRASRLRPRLLRPAEKPPRSVPL